MRLAVTGAAGFIGSHLTVALANQGHEVVALDGYLSESYDPAVKQATAGALQAKVDIDFHELDLRNPIDPSILEGVEVVINLAAMPGLSRDWNDAAIYHECNEDALGHLVTASKAVGVRRFVQASTSSVYGMSAVGDESVETLPISPYGASKLAAEKIVMSARDAGVFEASILRYFSVYGPGQRPDMAYHLFFEAIAAGQPIKVFGDGSQTRSNTFVGDIVAGTAAAALSTTWTGIANLGGGESIDLLGAISKISALVGKEPIIDWKPSVNGDQKETKANINTARENLGYAPKVTLDQGLALQHEWHKSGRDPKLGFELVERIYA